MKLKRIMQRIWRDPVWGNVIAFLIISFITAIYSGIGPLIKELSIYVKIGIILGVALLGAIIRLIIRCYKNNSNSRLIIYLSACGVGRDPMAKAITEKLLENKSLNFKINIKAMALIEVSGPKVEDAAKSAIIKIFNKDISGHIPTLITEQILEKADLVLVMDKSLLNIFKKKFVNYKNVYQFKEFFGLMGDVKDPCPDGKDEKTLKRYEKCALEMKDIIEKNLDKLIDAVKN